MPERSSLKTYKHRFCSTKTYMALLTYDSEIGKGESAKWELQVDKYCSLNNSHLYTNVRADSRVFPVPAEIWLKSSAEKIIIRGGS